MAALLRLFLVLSLFLAGSVTPALAQSPAHDGAAATTATETEPAVPATAAGDVTEAATATAPSPEPRDVVLVLDNSGSMRDNDSQSLAPAAVKEFIQQLSVDSRVALLLFDQKVTQAQDFISVDTGRDALLNSLQALDYSGQHTDSPAAIERAIYMLKNEARPDARRIIIFMTDGIVDTGNPQNDASRTEWLRSDLASAAERADIRIFGIAFTNNADFQLIQSLANQTEGDYFRALTAADLSHVFDRINEVMERQPEPEPVPQPAATVPAPAQPAAPEPIIIEVPAQPQPVSQDESTRTLILIIAASVLCLTLIAILVVLIRRSRADRPPEPEAEPKAFLSDIHGVTDKASHELNRKPTMIGRVGGTDTDHLHYIVIPETTVGRRHALIEYKDYAYWIIDQGSINGTYVNDRMVATETRLKHGDRIRLHKFEFEFVMPEMFDSGMTVVSSTVYANRMAADDAAERPEDAAGKAAAADYDNLFDITGNDDSTPSGGRITLSEDNYDEPEAEDATIQYGETPPALTADDDEDATLLPGMDPLADDADDDRTMRRSMSGSDPGDESDEWEIDKNNEHRRDD